MNGSFVKFEESGTSVSGKTRIWLIKNCNSDYEIGRVVWHAPWRKYVFEPAKNCIFDANCLSEIGAFLIEETKKHMAALKEARKCPTCESPDPNRHPAMQFEGEVQPCKDKFHNSK